MQENLAEKIKQRIDLVEFVRQYVPHLKKAGKTWKACCPFHKEKTPSFTVSSEKGLYYCFGCQEGGDIFDFLMKMENLSFNEAVRKLADIAGVEYRPQGGFSAAEQQRINARKTLDWAKGFYHKNLMSAGGEFARNYVKGRGLTKETVQKFELGFAKNDAVGLCKAAQANGYTAQQLKDVGLCVQTAYGARDYFRGRLMFPIINQRGETVGFGGRILADGEPKYLNSPETLLFSKSHVLFGLNFAGPAIRKAGRAVLLEGYMDVIAVNQAGHRFYNEVNAAYPNGTCYGFYDKVGGYVRGDWRNSSKIKPVFKNYIDAAMAMNEGSVGPDWSAGPQWAIFDSAAIKREQWKIDETTGEEGYFFVADTLDELQEKLTQNPYQKYKMPKGRLAETVKRYNEMVDKGVDEDFDKPKPKFKIEKAPFYAAWCTVCTHDTYAGLRVNGKNQVVDMKGQVIPGLYCGGESAGGCAQHGLGRCLTAGYIIGGEIVKEG